jgi:hypothetical protein
MLIECHSAEALDVAVRLNATMIDSDGQAL